MLVFIVALAAAAPGSPDAAAGVPGIDGPPWSLAADEARVADSRQFRDCDRFIALMARRGPIRLAAPRYAVSPRWGHVLRVELAAPDEDFSDTLRQRSSFVT